MNKFERWLHPSNKLTSVIILWTLYVLWSGLELAAATRNPEVDLNSWGLAAGLFLGLNAFDLFGWRRRRRMMLGYMAFAIMIGHIGVSPFDLDFMASWPPGLLLMGMPFGLLTVGTITMIAALIAALIVFLAVTALPVLLFLQLQQVDKALTIFRYRESGLMGYLGRGVRWLFNEAEPEAVPDDSKGARFATPREIALLTARPNQPDFAKAMVFGHERGPVPIVTEKHVLIMASTRSGKGVTLIIPHLLRYRGSAFVLDPKGENAKATGRCRAEFNDAVHYLDPFGISGKPQSRFNPLSRFTPENMEAESKALAAAMFVQNHGDNREDHWKAAGQQLLASFILFVYVSANIPPHMKDLTRVRKVLLSNVKPTLEVMQGMKEADGLLSDLATSFLETPEKEFGSILSTAQRQTEILDNPFIAASLKATGTTPEVNFDDWHNGSMTVYLCLSAPKFPTFNRWLRLILTSALDTMTDALNPPFLPVCFMLDELATLGHLTTVENAVGLAAGYGIQLVTVFQDVAQMRDLYKGRWASFISNAGIRAIFNLDDYDTAKYWSESIGNHLVETHSVKRDIYGYSDGDTQGENMRPLIPTDKMMMDYASGQMLVLAQGQHPFATRRIAYFDDRELISMWDDPRVPVKKQDPAARSKLLAALAAASSPHEEIIAPAAEPKVSPGLAAALSSVATEQPPDTATLSQAPPEMNFKKITLANGTTYFEAKATSFKKIQAQLKSRDKSD